jgi:hypothetical protein
VRSSSVSEARIRPWPSRTATSEESHSATPSRPQDALAVDGDTEPLVDGRANHPAAVFLVRGHLLDDLGPEEPFSAD